MNPKVEIVDRLSELPDQILIHILSFLPLIDAVRSMLLKRFGSLWTLLPILDFDQCNFDLWCDACPDDLTGDNVIDDDDDGCSSLNLAFFKFVRNVLVCHRRSNVTKFRVQIGDTYFSDIEEKNLTHELDSWIDFALRKNVEILEFYVGMVEPCELLYKLPHTEFFSASITEMKLEFLEMKLQTRVQMGRLRVLRLIRVDIDDNVFQEVVRGCPLLKEFEIYNCFSLSQLSFDATNIEKLILDTSEHYEFGPIVDCPNLRSFQFTGRVNCIEVKDLSSLVDVTFHLGSQHMEFKEFEQFMAALKPVLSAKGVSFSGGFVDVLFYCMQKQHSEISMNWKHVEVSMWLTEKHIPGICRLLRNSPYLEELVIHVTDSDQEFLKHIETELDNYSMGDEECSLSSLRRIAIYNISMCLYPILVHLVRTLLKNASALTELKIYYKANEKSPYDSVLSSEQWSELGNELPTFPKASQHVTVSLL